jgi:hypothetical protein
MKTHTHTHTHTTLMSGWGQSLSPGLAMRASSTSFVGSVVLGGVSRSASSSLLTCLSHWSASMGTKIEGRRLCHSDSHEDNKTTTNGQDLWNDWEYGTFHTRKIAQKWQQHLVLNSNNNSNNNPNGNAEAVPPLWDRLCSDKVKLATNALVPFMYA